MKPGSVVSCQLSVVRSDRANSLPTLPPHSARAERVDVEGARDGHVIASSRSTRFVPASGGSGRTLAVWLHVLLLGLVWAFVACTPIQAEEAPPEAPSPRRAELEREAVQRIRELRAQFLVRELALDANQLERLGGLLASHDEQRLQAHARCQSARRELVQALERGESGELDRLAKTFREALRARDALRLLPEDVDLGFLSAEQRAGLSLLLPRFDRRVEKRIQSALEKPKGKAAKGEGRGQGKGKGKGKGKGERRGQKKGWLRF